MMHVSFTACLRFVMCAGLVLFAVAVGVGHHGVPAALSDRVSSQRTPAATLAYVSTQNENVTRFLDVRNGAQVRVELPPGDRVEHASCTPWQDGAGNRLMAGRWSSIRGQVDSAVGENLGLGLYRLADGRLLDRVQTDIFPVAPVCWYPASMSRVLFAAGDGRLYRFDFASVHDESGLRSRVPEPISWAEGVEPSHQPTMISEPYWPSIAGWERTLLATISIREAGKTKFGLPDIWWLRLDETGSVIVDGGRLTILRESVELEADDHEERRAVLNSTSDGELVLLYQTRQAGTSRWQLLARPAWIDPGTGRPTVGRGRVVYEDTRVSNHALSADGHWVYTILRAWGVPAEIRRVPLSPLWMAGVDTPVPLVP